MRDHLLVALTERVAVREDGDDLVLTRHTEAGLRLRDPDASLRALVGHLAAGGMTSDALCDAVSAEVAGADFARLYYILETLGAKRFLRYTLAPKGRALATIESMSPGFRFEDPPLNGTFRVSRFACLRRDGSEMRLESPLGYASVRLHDGRGAVAIALLAEPRAVPDIAFAMDVDADAGAAFVSLLVNAGAVFSCDAGGRIAEDESVPLRQWEFHDLLFHTRSRLGRHVNPFGGTFRFAGDLPPLPAVKPPMSARRIALHTPDMAALDQSDAPCSRVLEARRSVRTPGEHPLSAAQVGEFLYRVARVKEMMPATPGQPRSYDASHRPCAGGGAMHEIELYLIVSRCAGLDAGLYHYAPLTHELEHLAEAGPLHARLVADACQACGQDTPPDVLIILAARFQRMAWKYASMAYAVSLKNAGVLYQQMYLVAAAMHLAPCGLGGGNSDLLAEAAGLDYYAETSVGEFMLSGI